MSTFQQSNILSPNNNSPSRFSSRAQQCEEHIGEFITNYCTALSCLKPLCPDCIDQHNKFHKLNMTFPQIESIKNVKIQCSQKIQLAMNQMVDQLDRLDYSIQQTDEGQYIDKDLEIIAQTRLQVYQMIQKYFDDLEVQYRRRQIELNNRGEDFDSVIKNIKKMLGELEYLNLNLESSNGIAVIKKVNLLLYQLSYQQLIFVQIIILYCFLLLQLQYLIYLIIFKFIIIYQRCNNQTQNNLLKKQRRVQRNFDLIVNDERMDIIQSEMVKLISLSQFQNQSQYTEKSRILQPYVKNDPTLKKPSIEQISEFQVTSPNYFQSSCNNKYLHFFPSDQMKALYILDLLYTELTDKVSFQLIPLNNDFHVNQFHKSLITPSGDIYVSGGNLQDKQKSRKLYLFQSISCKLLPKTDMILGRSSHCLQFLNGYIYAIGGFTNGQQLTKTCEKYSIAQDKWEYTAPLNHSCISASVTSFNGKFIFKFGGIMEGGIINNFIEKYDTITDKWNLIDVSFDDQQNVKTDNFHLLSAMCSVQINQYDILIFGGYNVENEGSNQSFILSHDKSSDQNSYLIKSINTKPLPYSEGFWNNTAYVFNQKVYAIQNITNDNQDDCKENDRRVLCFDQKNWLTLN